MTRCGVAISLSKNVLEAKLVTRAISDDERRIELPGEACSQEAMAALAVRRSKRYDGRLPSCRDLPGGLIVTELLILGRNFGIRAGIDITIIAAVFFVVVHTFRVSGTARIAAGLMIAGVIFVLANLLDPRVQVRKVDGQPIMRARARVWSY